MLASDIPVKFQIPFANNAGGPFIRTIPQASQVGIEVGAASLFDGFPPDTFTPVSAGGTPPFGQDFNGLLNQITAWNRWQNAGGTVKYDSTFSTAVGGYPQGAVIAGATSGILWLNRADNNTTNPDTGGANWVKLSTAFNIQNGEFSWATTGITGTNAMTATLAPVPVALVAGFTVVGVIGASNTGASSLNVNGLGVKSIVNLNGTALRPGALLAGMIAKFVYDGTNFQLQNNVAALTASLTTSGYQKLPSGLIVQWAYGVNDTGSGQNTQTITWPMVFPNACLAAFASCHLPSGPDQQADFWYETYSITTTNVGIQRQRGADVQSATTQPLAIGIGF